jgi:hypothetical protein
MKENGSRGHFRQMPGKARHPEVGIASDASVERGS